MKRKDKDWFRWDYRMGAWRSLHVISAKPRNTNPSPYWLKKCEVCGAEDLMTHQTRLCHDCSVAQFRRMQKVGAKAHGLVKKAVREGKLPRLDGSVLCVDCGAPALVYDHRSYEQPLDVQPVCKPCNWRRGPSKEAAPLWIKSRGARNG